MGPSSFLALDKAKLVLLEQPTLHLLSMVYNLTMTIGVEDKEQKCLECGRLCCNRRSLGNHLMRSHPTLGGQREYVLKHMCSGAVPKCGCGCGQDVQWHKLLYKFNTYVTGHNRSNLLDFKHTPEQVEKRNDAIRESYEKNGKEISEKIGVAVSQAFKDPVKNANLRAGQRRGWKNDVERKRKLSERNVEMLAQGIIGPQAPFKVEWIVNPFTKNKEWMHSSWESAFLQRCIHLNVPVTKSHSIRIPYVGLDGGNHLYIPDFVTLETFDLRLLFEIKGRRTETDDIKEKAARTWCKENDYQLVIVGTLSVLEPVG